jgi:hypothetical protein
VIVPALVLWSSPLLEPAGRRLSGLLSRVPSWTAAVLPLAITLFSVGIGYARLGPVVRMRDVRAVFGRTIEELLVTLPPGTTVGSLTYEELGATYAEIRERPIGQRVEQHKTMNPAQMEKFFRLRGRGDVRVVPVSEAARARPPRVIVAMNNDELRILFSRGDLVERAVHRQGQAAAGVLDFVGDSNQAPVR